MIYRGTVGQGVVELKGDVRLPDGALVNVELIEPRKVVTPKRPGTSLADWAERHAEDWGDQLSSEDVDTFTGRRL